jgi:simple sugar transport system permease protein
VQNPLVWIGVLAVALVTWLLYRTPFGLRVRAVGEHPIAAASVGVPVARVRYFAVAASGMLAGLGGAYLALDQHQFTDGMTAGRGFIALAAIIFGRWDPRRAALACLLFAAAETLQIQLQGSQALPSQFVEMIPYVLTIVALAGVVGRAVPPAALGKTTTE